MSEKVVNAALLGLGTVGTGVYKVIKNQEQEMTAKLGCQVKITKILVRNLEKASGIHLFLQQTGQISKEILLLIL